MYRNSIINSNSRLLSVRISIHSIMVHINNYKNINMTQYTEKERRILRHVQTMSVLATCIEVELQNDLVDHKFKEPNMNNHVRKLKESLQQIRRGLSFKYKVIDRDLMENEHGAQIHRLFTYFSTMDTNQLTQIMDAYEAYDKTNPPIVSDLLEQEIS